MFSIVKLLVLGLPLTIIACAMFEDVYKDGSLSIGWNKLAFMASLVTAIHLTHENQV